MDSARINEDIVSAIAIGNIKTIAEQPALLSNLAYANLVAVINLSQQNAVANQQSINEMGISMVARATNLISNLPYPWPSRDDPAKQVLPSS